MAKPETPYMETEALLAVMNEDDARLRAILDDLHPGEVRELYQQVSTLGNELWSRMQDNAERSYRPRHGVPRSTVPEDYSFHDDSPVIRGGDTGWEPGERDW